TERPQTEEEILAVEAMPTMEPQDAIAVAPMEIVPMQVPTTNPPRPTIYSSPFPTVADDSPGFFQAGAVVVAPTPIQLASPVTDKVYNLGRDNFIVDPMTSIIVMVVEPDILPRLKDLLRRIDVPRKMVQLDVLLFEKLNKHENNWG